jgi:hypothetical protein
MKCISSRILWAVAKLCAILAAILGCSSKGNPAKPREIRWKGQETSYQSTTIVSPGDGADGDGKK